MLVLSNDLVLSKSILIFNGTHFPFCTRFSRTFFQNLENVSRCYCHFENMDLFSKNIPQRNLLCRKYITETVFQELFFQNLENISRIWIPDVGRKYINGIIFQKSSCHFEGMDLRSKNPKTELGIFFHPKWRKNPESLLASKILRILNFWNWRFFEIFENSEFFLENVN